MSTSSEITTNAQAAEAALEKSKAAAEKVEKIVGKLDEAFKAVFTSIKSINKPGMELSTSMHDLAAMTGIAGNKLNEIEAYARKTAKTFGGSAASGVESYKLILDQLNPEIAKVPKALDQMGKSVAVTSKLMGGDQAAATELLTTAMKQYHVSLDDPIAASAEMAKMMNVMVAASDKGSAKLPQIKQALEACGESAKMANVSFEETNAAIQILDKAGSKGAEGGNALHNVLEKLGEGKYIPSEYKKQLEHLGVDTEKLADKNSSLAERLTALKPAMKDSALLSAWLGQGADGATKALMAQIPELENLTAKVTDSNSAYEKAAIVMDSPLEKNKKLQAQIDDFKISIFNGTNGLLGYADVIGEVVTGITSLTPVLEVFNLIMAANPVGIIVLALIALAAYITIAISKWDEFGASMMVMLGPLGFIISAIMSIKNHWDSIKNAFSSGGITSGLLRIGQVLLDAVLYPLQQLLELAAKIPGLGKLAGSGAEKIKNLRASMDLITANETKPKDTIEENAGIKPPKVPSTVISNGGRPVVGKNKTNEAIASGGTKNTVINITLKDLIGVLQISGKDFKDSTNQMKEQTQDALMRVLASANTAAG